MRFSSYLTTAVTAIGLLAASGHAASISYTGASGGDWNTPGNWSGAAVPTSSDDVSIPTNTVVKVTSASGVAQFVTIASGGQILIEDQTLTLSGSGSPTSSISLSASIKLDDPAAVLAVTDNHTFSGSGVIQMDDAGAEFTIASNKTVTLSMKLAGFGEVKGPGTLHNAYTVSAEGGELVLWSDLILTDVDQNPGRDGLWQSNSSTAMLTFENSATLNGDIKLLQGELHFEASVSFTGGTDATFTFDAGVISLLSGDVFTYDNFTGSCDNPDTSGPPYSVDSTGSPYSCT